jgi:hypothetical protein
MKTWLQWSVLVLFLMSGLAPAAIQRIDEGGQEIDLDDLLPDGEPAVLVLHTSWDQASITLVEEIASWASSYPNLAIFIVDVVDPRTRLYQQFNLSRIPSVLVFNDDHEQVGEPVQTVDDLEDRLEFIDAL